MGRYLRYHFPMSKPLPVLSARLKEAALHYLDRYDSSVQSVRRVLRRRVERWALKSGVPVEEGAFEVIETVIADLQRTGLLDDSRYAGVKARSLFRGGRSGRAIGAYLAQRGVSSEVIGEALETRAEEGEEGVEPDLEAALRFARKRICARRGASATWRRWAGPAFPGPSPRPWWMRKCDDSTSCIRYHCPPAR